MRYGVNVNEIWPAFFPVAEEYAEAESVYYFGEFTEEEIERIYAASKEWRECQTLMSERIGYDA